MKSLSGKAQKAKISLKWVLSLLLAATVQGTLLSQNDNCYPNKPQAFLVDAVGVLSKNEAVALEKRLRELNSTSSNQFVVVIMDELCAGDAAMTAYEIGRRWGVGQREFDNGIVILVKPTGGPGERHSFIATGYGLEGAIPDATAKLIVENEMIPNFRTGNYYKGLIAGIEVLAELAAGEYSFADYNDKNKARPESVIAPFLLVFIIWFLLFYRRTSKYSKRNNIGFWAALALMNAASKSHRGYYNNFRSGSGGFGGGGFGGFGGGRFGGGGAGGSW